MELTWRWFGKNDPITLQMLRQIGVEGIVTSLHAIKNGEIWPEEDIADLRTFIEDAGLRWSVVESLPVSESIKYGGKDRDELIDKYIVSLKNLGRQGVKTVCYNFMPVLDWARTDLRHPWPDGASSLYFDKAQFGYFELYILGRHGAEKDYTHEQLERIEKLKKTMTPELKRQLIDSIIVKTQGFVNGNISEDDASPVEKFRDLLALYDGIGAEELRQNMKYFLEAIMPVCRRYDVKMCVHPDDPPFQLLGLPRIVTCRDDIRRLLDAVPDEHNGLTFCAGSLSAGLQNDVPALAREFASRTHFVHLRSTRVLPGGDFIEAPHLEGRANVIELIRIFERERPGVPMRVDHGRLMLGDENREYNPGYSFHGRMMGLCQIEGALAVVHREMEEEA